MMTTSGKDRIDAPKPQRATDSSITLGTTNVPEGEVFFDEPQGVPLSETGALAGAQVPLGDKVATSAVVVPGLTPPAQLINLRVVRGATSGVGLRLGAWEPRQYPLSKFYPMKDPAPHDSTGVRLYYKNGRAYNHPVGQAQLGLASLYSYSINGDWAQMQRAVNNAQRLLDTAIASRGGMFFPYRFSYKAHGRSDAPFTAPWYSAMAQGQAASLFYRLYHATGDKKWKTAGDEAIDTLFIKPSKSYPWVTHVDSSGYLWLEEGPRDAPYKSERIFNGHMFALIGLIDAYQETRQARLLPMIRASLQTTSVYGTSWFRKPGAVSRYCLQHSTVRSLHYHAVHQRQLLSLYESTGDVRFARLRDALADDFPSSSPRGRLTLNGSGTYTAYRISGGRVVGYKNLYLRKTSVAGYRDRQRIPGSGIAYQVRDGSLAGYWLFERPGRIYSRTAVEPATYTPARRIALSKGAHTAVRFTATGEIGATKRIQARSATGSLFTRRAYFRGQPWVLISAGTLKGYWLPTSSRARP